MRYFKIRKGKMSRAQLEESGGKFRKVSLDTTDDHLIRYAYLQVNDEDAELRNFDVVTQSIYAAGQAFARNILDDVLAQHVNQAANVQPLGGDKYFVAVMKAIALNKFDGFGCNAIVFDQDDFVQAITEETTGGTMPWLLQLQNMTPLGDNFSSNFGMSDGLVGRLFNRIPVYVVSGNSTLSGNIVLVDSQSAAVFGFAPGGAIEIKDSID